MTNVVDRLDVEVKQPWGDYSNAVDAAFRFWEWWDRDSDSDRSLSAGPMEASKRTVQSRLPSGHEDDSLAEDIVNGARLLTMGSTYGEDRYREVFNGLLFHLSIGDEMPSVELGFSYPEIEEEYVRGLEALAKLAVNKGVENNG